MIALVRGLAAAPLLLLALAVYSVAEALREAARLVMGPEWYDEVRARLDEKAQR